MKGKWFYFALAGLLGIISALENFPLYFFVFSCCLLWMLLLKKWPSKHLAAVAIIFVLFFLRGEIAGKFNRSEYSGKETVFTVELKEQIKTDGNSFSAFVKDLKKGEVFLLRYKIGSADEKRHLERLLPGTLCAVKGELKKVRPATNENAFDYRKYLQNKGIFWRLDAEKLTVKPASATPGLFTAVQRLRQKGIFYIYEHFPKETAPLAAALIFGDRSEMEEDLLAAYQRLGIIHLLAISGLHVSMLAGMLFFLMIRLNMTRERAMDILIVFLPFYSLIAGASPSVLRACAMTLIVLLIIRFGSGFRKVSVDVFSTVFSVYIFLRPFVIYDAGFQLSFLVTFSLLLSSSFLGKLENRPLALLAGTSVIAQLASVPVMLHHFYEFSFLGIFANILYVPFYSFIVLPLMFFLFFSHLAAGSLIEPFQYVFEIVLEWANQLAKSCSRLPFSTIVLGRPSPLFMCLYLLAISFSFFRLEKAETIKKGCLALFIPAGLMLFQHVTTVYSAKGEVTMIDVGQGDSMFIKLPFNQGTYLIDTGGVLRFDQEEWKKRDHPFDPGKDIVVPFLKSKGITALDKLILTHGDMDHIGGAPAVLEALRVKEVVLPQSGKRAEMEEKILGYCREKGISVRFVRPGDSWPAGDTRFYVLASGMEHASKNNQSIVLFARLGELDWLFTGDLEVEGESLLMVRYPALSADVLKVAHHGSDTSTSESFLDFLAPKIALISAGENNRFGHPKEEVLERLERRKIRIFRTDKHGAVSFYFTKRRGTFSVNYHRME